MNQRYRVLDTHIREINESENDVATNDAILRTIEYLLDNIINSKKVFSAYGEMEMLLLYADTGKIAEAVCALFETSKSYFNPAKIIQENIQRLSEVSEQVEERQSLIKSMEKSNADLLKQERELVKKSEEYDELSRRVSQLQRANNINEDDIKSLISKETELNEIIASQEKDLIERKETIKKLEEIINEYTDVLKLLSETIITENAKTQTLDENIRSMIEQKRDTLQKIYRENSADLIAIEEEMKSYVEQYNDLKNKLQKSNNLCEQYRLHLGENSKIVKKMKEYGISSLSKSSIEIRKTETIIKNELDEFDKKIKKIIDVQEGTEKAVDEIEKTKVNHK